MDTPTRIDLHSHTTASDGALTPTELVRKAHSVGITVLAVTDHDTVSGLEEAREEAGHQGIRIVPGVEFGIEVGGTEVHMLGYLFDDKHPVLLEKLGELREGRLNRGKKMVEKLRAIGININWARVAEIAGDGSVGRPHVARALIEGGYASSIDEAFKKYISRGRPAFVERTHLTLEECIDLVHQAGGAAVLAHPTFVKEVERVLPSLVKAGLDGIETYYGRYTDETIHWIEGLAKKYSLVTTGGSDFHGLDALSHAELGSVDVPPRCLVELEQRVGSRAGLH
ncbi:MAG TPA: PHP domain-containing protein [Chloroflexia bacterium]|nr:PHP domain-containing protein [Chloroflexia bacterium]